MKTFQKQTIGSNYSSKLSSLKKYRKRFKTTKGVKRFLRNGKIKWYENIVLKTEIIPDKNDAWSKLSQKYGKNKLMTKS